MKSVLAGRLCQPVEAPIGLRLRVSGRLVGQPEAIEEMGSAKLASSQAETLRLALYGGSPP